MTIIDVHTYIQEEVSIINRRKGLARVEKLLQIVTDTNIRLDTRVNILPPSQQYVHAGEVCKRNEKSRKRSPTYHSAHESGEGYFGGSEARLL